jgi:hypothetical protein
MAWLPAGPNELAAGDTVRVRMLGVDGLGTVVIAPDQFLRAPENTKGMILEVVPAEEQVESDELPLADLPPLGRDARTPAGSGTVIGVDPVHGMVMLRGADGETFQCAAGDVQEEGLDGR